MSNKGFTLLEMCTVMLVISIMSLTVLPAGTFQEGQWYTFADRYFHAQAQAMAESRETAFSDESGEVPLIRFNHKGNVSRAMTLTMGKKGRSVIIELGGGRLVYPERRNR